jgi:phage FluMu protein Com
MAIELHCEHCGKLVKAPDDAAGKHGKCPTCHQSVYIPSADVEPLDLQPIDAAAEAAVRRAEEESRALQRALLKEREAGPERAGDDSRNRGGQVLEPRLDMETLIIEYAAAMASGDLNQAEQYAADIKRDMAKAEDVMQRLTVDEMPHELLVVIPRPVLVGFFKQLRQ